MSANGPFFFAWANAGEAFSEASHAKWDDDIFEFSIEQNEGDFATLRIIIRNPRIGLLAPGRKVWGWFSWRDNNGTIVPLFFGRLIGVPEQIQADVVELNFIARPEDFAEQKVTVANGLKVRPYWDAIWFSPETKDDPDNVLESRPALWHIDRVTHEVSISDITAGEDGTITATDVIGLYDSVQVTYSQNPARKVNVKASVSWDQAAKGSFNLTPGLGMAIISRTGEGIFNAWPKTGASIGGGWSWIFSNIKVLSGPIASEIVGQGTPDNSAYMDGGFDVGLGHFGVPNPTQNIGWSYHLAIPLWRMIGFLTLGYDVSRRKGETLEFTLEADVQPTLTEPEDQATINIDMSTSEVVEQGAIPARSSVYFATARGSHSIEYLIAVARAQLLARARAVNVTFQVPFPFAVAQGISCRKNAIVNDARLPAGTAGGKIKSYSLSLSGGKQIAEIVIGCMVGRGGTVSAQLGTPDYAEEDYCGNDYQFYVGAELVPFNDDVKYTVIEGTPAIDDGIDFNRLLHTAMIQFGVVEQVDPLPDGYEIGTAAMNRSPANDQEQAMSKFAVKVDEKGSLDAKNIRYDQLRIELKDLTGGPFDMPFALETSELKIAKTIDLEAAA